MIGVVGVVFEITTLGVSTFTQPVVSHADAETTILVTQCQVKLFGVVWVADADVSPCTE